MIRFIEKNFRYLELVLVALLFGLALSYDSMHFPRAYTFIFAFGGFAGLIVLRMRKLSHKVERLSYIASIVLVIFLEFNSRYIINYFIHILYILLIIELSVSLKSMADLWLALLITGAGMYKYVELIGYKPAMSTYAEATFFLLLNMMSVFVITLMHGLREEQRKLIEANDQLETYADEVERLTEVKTRADIASQIHDGIGHNLTALIMQLEMTSHLLDVNPELAKDNLESAKETARDNLVQVRRAVKTMDQPEGKFDLEGLIKRFSNKTGVKISWEIDGSIVMDLRQRECVYRAVQEAMTNALRHGEAQNVEVKLIKQESPDFGKQAILMVKDDGIITQQPTAGYGLNKMKERFQALNGSVDIQIDSGMILECRFPYSDSHSDLHSDERTDFK